MISEQSEHDSNSALNSNQIKLNSFIYETKYPTFLPDDYTLDETNGLTEHSTGPLSKELFKNVNILSNKLCQDISNSCIQLTEDELLFTQ
jgi:hypothetical protein